MARINVIRNSNGGLEYLQNAVGYVSDDRALFEGGYGVTPYNTTTAFNQMLATRQYFGKVSGNPLVHIIIAYNDSVTDIETASKFGKKCAQFFASRFQLLYCTHARDFHCGQLHTHIVINSVSYINGRMVTTGYDEMKAYCDYVAQVTGQRTQFYFDNKVAY